jgi:WD40 repeat protein
VITSLNVGSYEVVVIDIATATVRSRHPLPKGTLSLLYTSPPNIFRWSPDGRRILVSWDRLVVVDIERGGAPLSLPGGVIAEWAPGSDAIYYFQLARSSSRPNGFYFRHLAASEPVRLMDADGLAAAGFRPARWLINGVMVLSPSGPVALERPSHTFYSEDLMTAVEWSPDEKSLAVLAVVAQAKEEKPVHVRVVDLASGTWRTVARVEFQLRTPDVDLLGFKILSWTQ